MPNQHEWMPQSPQSMNGWGQAVSYQLFAIRRELDHLYERLKDYVPGGTVVNRAYMDREIDRLYEELYRIQDKLKTSEPKASLMTVIKDFLIANAWQIGLAVFALGASIGKTGQFPNPLELLIGAIKGMSGG